MGEVVMSIKDQKVYEQAVQVICKRLTISEFTQLNGKSYRQCQRIIQKVRKHGMRGVSSLNLDRLIAFVAAKARDKNGMSDIEVYTFEEDIPSGSLLEVDLNLLLFLGEMGRLRRFRIK